MGLISAATANFYLTSGTTTKTALLSTLNNNLEGFDVWHYIVFARYSTSPWPIPSLSKTKRPRPAEIARYADWSARKQGPSTFTWHFDGMELEQFQIYMYLVGFYTGGVLTDSGLYSAAVTVQTRDDMGNYRCYNGTIIRPEPGKTVHGEVGGGVKDVDFEFVGCTEIFT